MMAHTPEPEVAVHPDDTTLAHGALARVTSRHGEAVLRLRHDPGQARGTAFAPMHWTDAFCPPALVNRLVSDATDPISGQPELKATPVALSLADVDWQGFVLLRYRLPATTAAWCASVPEPGGIWRHEVAGKGSALSAIASLIGVSGVSGEWLRLNDPVAGNHRAVLVADGILAACVFVASRGVLPPRGWLVAEFAAPAPMRFALLAGGPPGGAPASPTVCICHGIGAAAIGVAIAAGCLSTAAIGQATGAGTGCGSCQPELRAMLGNAALPAGRGTCI